MPVHRVQAGVLATGLVRRRFGWHSLKFVSLANDAKSASHDVVPFAQPDEIAPVARAASIALPGPDTRWHRPSRRPWTDSFVFFAAALTAVGPEIRVVLANSFTLGGDMTLKIRCAKGLESTP